MERGPYRGYFPNPAKSIFILDTPGQEEEVRQEFAAEGLVIIFFSGSPFLGGYLGYQEELGVWVKPQVDSWAHGLRVLGKTAQ